MCGEVASVWGSAHAEPALNLCAGAANAALLHRRDEVQHVAFRLAREGVKGVLVGIRVEAVRAIALMNRAAAPEFRSVASQFDAVPFQHLLDGHGRLDRLEVL